MRLPLARRRAITESTASRPGRIPGWLPPLLWAAVILGASSVQDLRTTHEGIAIRDKLAHFGEYFVFGWLLSGTFDRQAWTPRRAFAWTLFFGALMGALDEFYQGFVPGRQQDPFDFLADTLGAAAGWYFSREEKSVGSVCGTARDS
ncbi:MAG: VanZ family protein [Gemmatimonadota bacterium]|nr:VanZ family protein [Gemmatimonadota bacterium]MDP6529100.1 VanZ family protein [Gemmatimonadota bacterium]MDP6801663.1 VanZ family protein [Gemmatimonadota bacterium]MDP7030790.1 VanZ family protein [Gemmatimonadota bacterium]